MNEPNKKTSQEKFWLSNFGKEFLKRNFTYEDFNDIFKKQTGFDVGKPFQDFFVDLDRFLVALGSPNRPKIAKKSIKKCVAKRGAQRTAQEGPKRA